MYPDSAFNCLQGEKEFEDLESGRRTRSWVHLDNKVNSKFFASPWDLDFEQNMWNVFPPSQLQDKEFSKQLSSSLDNFVSSNELAFDFMYSIPKEIRGHYYSCIPLEMNIDQISKWVYYQYYHSLPALLSDISLIKLNCDLYNPPESPYCLNIAPIVKSLESLVLGGKLKRANVVRVRRVEEEKFEHDWPRRSV